MIRLATSADFGRLQEIEVLAGAAFREVGMPEIAEDGPPTVVELAGFVAGGRAWVGEYREQVVGYLLAEVVGGCAHVAQVSVDPVVRGRGLGRALVDHLESWARQHNLEALTLTTFRDVPWNAPYYERIGFRTVKPTPALQAVVDHEATLGLDPTTRVCMRRDL
ncbi:GNAT family N-acetyltransferase [Actinokineospora cianjurensis]|uniref:Ribosomal protein S18 acetylase RimI-like enzyme n=1 Tax=Actinokineospora cianjurensis TaxID=585224 RepID=A0A421B9J2_9PSEU|nr:GNAT family N-acetyltransferase [Actinokineospora cianjurensis]RLK60860.1 ribosomal protein S18 acetylase RimI-like enzyme [Actinokineospora cianjurensis]